MNSIKVGVIAGTPVDTQMGVDFLTGKGVNTLGYPVSSCPEEQSKCQILSPTELASKIRDIIKKAKGEGINIIVIYCNSLSAAVDMDKLSIEEDIKIITPLKVYKKIAYKYKNLGVLAANNQSTSGIERVIQSVNSNCNVIGIGILPLVIAIEKSMSSEEIVESFGLKNVIEFYNSMKVDSIILGCTHFPYICEALKKYTSIPIIDPAELMYEMLI